MQQTPAPGLTCATGGPGNCQRRGVCDPQAVPNGRLNSLAVVQKLMSRKLRGADTARTDAKLRPAGRHRSTWQLPSDATRRMFLQDFQWSFRQIDRLMCIRAAIDFLLVGMAVSPGADICSGPM